MNKGYKKYQAFIGPDLPNRTWPNRRITEPPVWCSVDLRDGNQALVNPMNLNQKIAFFNKLVEIGFKEIEVGFPSASETEYEIVRTLIEKNLIPDDVTIQVLVQAREHLIRKTFDAVEGAKNVIIHFYNSTSTLQRKVVFNTDVEGVTEIAVNGAKLVRELAESMRKRTGANIRYEYSPESFSGTEPETAVYVCDKVLEALGSTKDDKVIFNLPNTVEMCTPNTYADQIEYFINNISDREACIISLHPHNDRGTGTAACELALMAGADRVEGTLFGNGERTGNVDIINLAMNMYSQGIDPKLDFHDLKEIQRVYEACTDMKVHPRHPYAGELVFTAFSGSHQDAIKKGLEYQQRTNADFWEVPYLPIDPADLGREYEPIIRINSQSGKGGAAFILQWNYGFNLPKAMQAEFGVDVKAACDKAGREITPEEVYDLFDKKYLKMTSPYEVKKCKISEEELNDGTTSVTYCGIISIDGVDKDICATGGGPIEAFINALKDLGVDGFKFIDYSQHAISVGADSKAVSYIHLETSDGQRIFGAGIDKNITHASLKGVISAINRFISKDK